MPAKPQVIRINTLSGGVARQAPSKRLPTEVQNADNVFLSLERSAEKRQPFSFINAEGDSGSLNITEGSNDILYYYFDLDGTNKQVIALNPSATLDANLVQIFDAETGTRETASSLAASLNSNPEFRTYINTGTGSVSDRIRFVEIRGNLLILNTEVEAKFLTSGDGAAITYTDPVTGLKVRDLNQEVDPDGVLQDIGLNRKNYSQFRLPPDPSDTSKGNGADAIVGPGLVWYARESYLDFPGQAFYQANSSTQQPWYNLIRSEQQGSLLDGDTWPWLLEYDSINDDFAIGKPKWAPRYSGTEGNNPGPSPLADSPSPYASSGNTGAKIQSAVFFRNRLWFSSGDTMFSSEHNDPYNLYIQDPSAIVDTDPIDIVASSGANSTVTWMVPFADFLFVTTTGQTQYELTGSNNFIGPNTAALEPTSFYGTSRFNRPEKVGSLLYFTDAGRLFMYFGAATENVQTAVNVSQNVFGYFPQTVSAIVAAPNQDTLAFVDADNENHIYAYTARFDGDKQVQNAFYRWVLSDDAEVKALYVIDNYMHIIVRRPTSVDGTGTPTAWGTFIERMYLERTVHSDVMLDRVTTVTGTAQGADTLFSLPYVPSPTEEVVVWYDNQELDGILENSGDAWWFRATNVSLAGIDAQAGEKYTMQLELSTPMMRDGKNNFVDGRMSLKDMNIRHYNTGAYDVAIYRWNRDPSIVSFDPFHANNPMTILGTDNYYEVEGSFSPKVQGIPSETSIHIQSSSPTPVNITNLEYRVSFAPAMSGSITD